MTTKPLTAKALGAILRVAGQFGVLELEIPGVVRFSRQPPAPPAPVAHVAPGSGIDLDVADDDPPGLGDDEGDPRFLIERLHAANHKPKAA